MIEHPGVYEIIQWASWNGTEETAIILMIIYLYLKHLFAHVALIQIRPLKF